MAERSTVLAIDLIHRLLHLGHVLRRTRIQGLLPRRLLRTGAASKGRLQARIGPQSRIDFHHPMCPCQQGDKAIIELVSWAMLDRLLRDLHQSVNWFKQSELLQLDSQTRQTCRRRLVRRDVRGKLVHGDASPSEVDSSSSIRYGPSPLFWQALSTALCHYFGQNLGIYAEDVPAFRLKAERSKSIRGTLQESRGC
jgi:hypothetical protein